jgi:pilus assembly protein CpaB
LKPSVLIALALSAGAVAVFLVARWVGVGGAAHRGPPVVVAVVAVEGGEPLVSVQLQVLAWPGISPPQGAFSSVDAVAGRIPRQPLVPGEPVLESRLVPVDGRAGLASVLSPGKRAITVRVNDVIGVAGFALPGTFVDVLVSARDANNEPFSRIVLERVKVLAVAQDTVSAPAKPKVVNAVTLELTPDESERLDLARSVGSLSLALRNELDKTRQTSAGTRLDTLMGVVPTASAVPALAGSAARAAPVKRGRASATNPMPPAVQELRGTQSGLEPAPGSPR